MQEVRAYERGKKSRHGILKLKPWLLAGFILVALMLIGSVQATVTNNTSLYSYGIIAYPTPTPTPTPSPPSANLALPFQSATYANGNVGWGWLDTSDDILIYSDDATVEHTVGNPSIKLGWHVTGVDNNIYREIDGSWIPVNVGDHIVFSVWIKTGNGTNADDNSYGGRIGIDLYGYVDGVLQAIAWYPQYSANSAVPWGSDWTKLTFNVVVPSDIYGSVNPFNGQPYTIHSNGPYAIIPWCDVRTTTDPNYVWFADAELYINPT